MFQKISQVNLRERKNKGKSKAPAPLSPQVIDSIFINNPPWPISGHGMLLLGVPWFSNRHEKGFSRHPKVVF